jgi:hypothetical protein
MSIKQYGGVFGRNPTFNEIDSDGNANLGDGTLFVDSVNKRVGIDKTNPQYPLDFNTAATGMVARFGDDNVDSYVSFSNPRTFFGYHTGNTMVQSGAGKKIIFYTGSNTAGDAAAVAAEFTTSGNLAFPSGQGIDFSATAGTGTSELLDDYEEGTWTPTVTTGTVTGSGNYTKIGDLVTVRGVLTSFSDRTTAANIIVGGLPFSSTLFQSGGSAFGRYVSIPASTAVVGSTSKINFYEMASGNYGVLQHSNLTSSSSAVYFEATYLSS